jgi:hypothetical protein
MILSRVDSSILPSSPAQIMSPPLESQLFFCSPFTPHSISMPLVPYKGEGQASEPMLVTQTHPPDERNKVLSPTPLPLPFASSPETSPYSNLLGKSPTAYDDVSVTPFGNIETSNYAIPAENTKSPLLPKVIPKGGRGTPAARQLARHGALNKVDQIMLKGWSERDLAGAGGTSSPTMFGAVPGGEEDAVFQGGMQYNDGR